MSKGGRERRPGAGVERKNLETQGITKVSLTLKVTAVVLRRPQAAATDQESNKQAILVTPRHVRKSESDAGCEGC
jgi:hypothetical protein